MSNTKFDIGDRVIVIAKHIQSYKQTGMIVGYYSSTSCKVHFNNWNGKGKKDLFIKNIYLERTGKNMAVKGNYDVAIVKFIQGMNTTKEYAFALFDKDVQKDDFVLCDTANGYGVAKVVDIKSQVDYNGVLITKEIICKVDFTAYNQRVENRKRKESLKKRMDNMLAANQELVLYKALAEVNPEMKALLEEYQGLE